MYIYYLSASELISCVEEPRINVQRSTTKQTCTCYSLPVLHRTHIHRSIHVHLTRQHNADQVAFRCPCSKAGVANANSRTCALALPSHRRQRRQRRSLHGLSRLFTGFWASSLSCGQLGCQDEGRNVEHNSQMEPLPRVCSARLPHRHYGMPAACLFYIERHRPAQGSWLRACLRLDPWTVPPDHI